MWVRVLVRVRVCSEGEVWVRVYSGGEEWVRVCSEGEGVGEGNGEDMQ